MNNFPVAVETLLSLEGGYVNDPNDPGGETNFGISKTAYPSLDIRNMTRDQAKEIYYNDFWIKHRLNEIDDQDVATAALDTLVQHGAGARILQASLNAAGKRVIVDGVIGPATIAAINSVPTKAYLSAIYEQRKSYYENLVSKNPRLGKFLDGWIARIKKWDFGTGAAAVVALSVAGVAASVFFLTRKRRKANQP